MEWGFFVILHYSDCLLMKKDVLACYQYQNYLFDVAVLSHDLPQRLTLYSNMMMSIK